MLLFILFLVFGIAFIAIAAIIDNNLGDEALVLIVSLIGCGCLAGALFTGLDMALAKSDAKNFIARKEFYDDLLANVDENASTETVCKIIDEVKSNNEKILKHRALDHNIFVGKLYRTEVAELELTPIPEMQIKKVNNELQEP